MSKNISRFNMYNLISKKFGNLNAKTIISKNPSRSILKVQTKYVDDYNKVANLISDQFKIIKASQIYKGKVFEGMMEIENKLAEEASLAKVRDIVSRVAPIGYEDLVSVELKDYAEKEKVQSQITGKDMKKYSVFSKNQDVTGIVQARLYFKSSHHSGHLENTGEVINHEYGVIIDKLEENANEFEIIEILAEPDFGYLEDEHVEYNRISKFMEMLRRNDILKNKFISLKSKKSVVVLKSLELGIDFVTDAAGTSDINVIEAVAQRKMPYIFSAFAQQDRLPDANKNPVDTFLRSVNKRLELLYSKDILNSNIAIDLSYEKFSTKFSSEIIKNSDVIKKSLDNVLIAPIITGKDQSETENNIQHLLTQGVNIIRYNSFGEFERNKQYINKIKDQVGEKLANSEIDDKKIGLRKIEA